MDTDPQPSSSGSSYWLGEHDRAEFALRATNGDKDAAYRLVQFYSFVNFDPVKSSIWLSQAAKNGHEIAQYNLALEFMDNENEDLSKAAYWANEALTNGNQAAKNLLEEIESKRRSATQ